MSERNSLFDVSEVDSGQSALFCGSAITCGGRRGH